MNAHGLSLALLVSGLLLASSAWADPAGAGRWVGTWATSPQAGVAADAPPGPGLAGNTLRQIAHVSIGGKSLRVRFSNAFGATPLVLSAAHVARAAGGGAILPASDRALTFHGAAGVTIPAGAVAVSDPLAFDLAPLSDLAVTIRVAAVPRVLTTHPGARATSYLQAGDAVAAATLPDAARVEHWYFLTGIDVPAGKSGAAVVILGDSITDGRGSTTDGNDRWTDDLARRLHADPRTADIGVLNAGIGGNRLLHDGLGPRALSRLDRDVFAQTGVRWLIVFEGVNDIGPSKSADAGAIAHGVIGAYERIITQAHAHHLRVYGATITPFGHSFYFSPVHEAARQQINAWIRAGNGFDGVIDFDAALRDPQDPVRIADGLHSGDHLHPNPAGYARLAAAVDLSLFAR